MKNKGADQTVPMCRLVCAFAVCKPPKTGFLASRPILTSMPEVMVLNEPVSIIRYKLVCAYSEDWSQSAHSV